MRALVVVCVALLAASSPLADGQSTSAGSVRPPDEIPFARLKADAVIPVPLRAGAAATADGVVVPTDDGISRIAATTSHVVSTALHGQRPCASLAIGLGAIWAPLCAAGRVARVDEKTMGVGRPVEVVPADPVGRVATSVGSLWVASASRGIVSRIDPDTGGVVAEIRVAAEPSSIASDDDALWITSATGNVLTHVNAHTNVVVDAVKVGPHPGRLAIGEGAVWTLNRGDGSISRVDPKTHKADATIAVGPAAAEGDIAVGAGSVWVTAKGVPLVRIDPVAKRVAQRFTGDGGGAVLFAHGSLWVAASATETWRLDPRLVAALRP